MTWKAKILTDPEAVGPYADWCEEAAETYDVETGDCGKCDGGLIVGRSDHFAENCPECNGTGKATTELAEGRAVAYMRAIDWLAGNCPECQQMIVAGFDMGCLPPRRDCPHCHGEPLYLPMLRAFAADPCAERRVWKIPKQEWQGGSGDVRYAGPLSEGLLWFLEAGELWEFGSGWATTLAPQESDRRPTPSAAILAAAESYLRSR